MIKRNLMLLLMLCVVLTAGTGKAPVSAAPAPPLFALHDGDTVVFYGDSITEQLMYGRDIETFVDTRFPRIHVKFINSGWSGDKVGGGGGGPIDLRLTRDVVNYKPTVVTIFLGMNDGEYKPYDEGRFQVYAAGLTHIVDTLTRALPGVRLTLLTPSFFDYNAKARPPLPATPDGYNFGNPAPDYNQTLLKYGAFVKKFGAEHHLIVADLNAPMAAATAAGRQTDPHFALSGDGVHPNEQGHLIMATAVLTAWHAAPMPTVFLVPHVPTPVSDPLPWPLPSPALTGLPNAPQVTILHKWMVSMPGIAGSADAQFRLRVDDELLGIVTAGPLLQGIDLTDYPALPQDILSQSVLALVQQRTDAWHDFWKGSNGLTHSNDTPTADELAELRAEDAKLDTLRAQARAAAQPHTHTFALQTP